MIRVLENIGDGINERITTDPRLTKAQREAVRAAAESDPKAACLGLDGKHRPVVRARLPGPRKVVEYALLRNGEATKITRPFLEVWE